LKIFAVLRLLSAFSLVFVPTLLNLTPLKTLPYRNRLTSLFDTLGWAWAYSAGLVCTLYFRSSRLAF